jgi:hypothetical protein
VAVEDCEEAEGGLPVHADLNDVGVLRTRKGDGRWGGGEGSEGGGRAVVVGFRASAGPPAAQWSARLCPCATGAIFPPRRRSRAGPRERPLHAAGATQPRVFPFPAPPNAVRDGRGPSAANRDGAARPASLTGSSHSWRPVRGTCGRLRTLCDAHGRRVSGG